MKAVKFTVVLCAVLFVSAFLTINSLAQKTENGSPTDTKTAETKPSVADDNTDGSDRQNNEKYRIGFQDTLEIQIFNHQNLAPAPINVNPDGTIMLPKIDRPIVAVCKTERELADDITALYKSYLKNPFVNVRVVDQRSQPFSVIGAVEKPGSFNLNRKIRLLELLAFAGGPDYEIAGANIQIARVGNALGCVEEADSDATQNLAFFRYKIKDVMDGKENPWMQPGDIVTVSDVENAYVVGNVTKASKVPLKEPVTLTQAIAYAGGLAPEAKTSKVRIQRQQSGSTARTETVYDLKDIVSRKIADPVLQPNDIVEVPKDGVKSVRNGIIKAFTGGLPTLIRGY